MPSTVPGAHEEKPCQKRNVASGEHLEKIPLDFSRASRGRFRGPADVLCCGRYGGKKADAKFFMASTEACEDQNCFFATASQQQKTSLLSAAVLGFGRYGRKKTDAKISCLLRKRARSTARLRTIQKRGQKEYYPVLRGLPRGVFEPEHRVLLEAICHIFIYIYIYIISLNIYSISLYILKKKPAAGLHWQGQVFLGR